MQFKNDIIYSESRVPWNFNNFLRIFKMFVKEEKGMGIVDLLLIGKI